MAPWSIVLALALTGPCAEAALEWASGGGICTGWNESIVQIGEKGSSDCDIGSTPAEYVTMAVQNMILISGGDDAYLTDDSLLETVDRTANKEFATTETIGNGNTFQAVMVNTGSLMGVVNPAGSYGFLGTASYLLTEGEMSYNTNNFKALGPIVDTPVDFNNVCVVGLEDGVCGAERTATPGTYKFSIYGYTAGEQWENFVTTNGFTHLGVRQSFDVSAMGAGVKVSVDGGEATSVDAIGTGNTSISSVNITGANTSLVINFEKKYIVGNSSTGQPVPMMTKDASIHCLSSSSTVFFIDYVFEIADYLNAGDGYFVYDPEVSSGAQEIITVTDPDGGSYSVQMVLPFLALIFSLIRSHLH